MIFEAVSHRASIQEVLPLRQKILRPRSTIEECEYPEDKQALTIHIGTHIGNKLVTVATFVNEGHPDFFYGHCYRLRGMATDDSFQHQGYGTQALSKGLEHMRKLNVDFVWCKARIRAFTFYEKMGFFFHGPYFDIPSIGLHKIMYRRLLK